jgi:hypothetical protein
MTIPFDYFFNRLPKIIPPKNSMHIEIIFSTILGIKLFSREILIKLINPSIAIIMQITFIVMVFNFIVQQPNSLNNYYIIPHFVS